jgi:hypothetical protein
MSASQHWTVRLGIEPGERKGVQLLFLHNFLQGLGIAFFATGSVSMFLHEFGPMGLALSLAAGGGAMLLASRIYAHFEHKVALSKFLPGAVLFLALAALLSWGGLFVSHGAWLLFALFTLYRVHYLVSSLEFWGLTALLYNVRQGKRLFGLIGSAEIPAKILGFASVYLLVPLLGEQNLLLLSALFFGGSFFVVRQLVRSHAHGLDHGHGHAHSHPERFLLRFFGNKFILRLSVFALLMGIALVLIEYAFYGEVKLKFHESKDLSLFLSAFLSGVMSITFVVKLLFSGKVLLRVGMRNSLLFFVIVLVSCSAIILFIPPGPKGMTYLVLFMVLYAVRDTLRFSIYDPAFLSLFQPLSPALRLKGHTVIKGVVDAVAMTAAGLLLVALLWAKGNTAITVSHGSHAAQANHAPEELHVLHDDHGGHDVAAAEPSHTDAHSVSGSHEEQGSVLHPLLVALLISLGLSLPALVVAHKEWLRTLQSALRKRFLDGGSVQLGDRETLEMIGQLLSSEKPGEVIYGLQLMQQAAPDQLGQAVSQCLRHPSPEVVDKALDLLAQNGEAPAADALRQMLLIPIPKLRAKALALLAAQATDWKQLASPEHLTQPALRFSLLEGLMLNPQANAGEWAIAEARRSLNSHDAEELSKALAFSSKWGLTLSENDRTRLERHADPIVRRETALVLVRTGNEPLLRNLLERAQHGPEKGEARMLLTLAGEQVMLPPESIDDGTRLLLCHLLGRHRTAKASAYLLSLLPKASHLVRSAAVEALAEQEYVAQGDAHRQLTALLEASHQRLQKVLRGMFVFGKVENERSVHEALRIELAEEVNDALHLLSCLGGPAEVRRARQGLRSQSHDLRADGIEAIDHLLAQPLRKAFTAALEHLHLQRSLPAPAVPASDHGKELRQLLRDWDGSFHAWTLAAIVECLALHHPSPALTDADLPAGTLPPLALDALVALERQHPAAMAHLFANTSIRSQMSHHKPSSDESHSTLSLVEKVMFLRKVSLFEGTPDHVLAEVASVCREARSSAGDLLIRSGEQGNCMYIVVEGGVRIERQGQSLASFGPGDFFGELSLLEAEVRTADAIAQEDSLLLRVDQDDFYELIEDRHEVMQAIMVTLARRIRKQNEVIAEMSSTGK